MTVLIRKRNAFVDFLQGQFALDGGKWQNVLKCLESGENPVFRSDGCGLMFLGGDGNVRQVPCLGKRGRIPATRRGVGND